MGYAPAMATSMSEKFAAMRHKAGLTLLEIANRCDLNESTVWKIEGKRRLRWETIHTILVVGLKLPPDGPDYAVMEKLWIEDRKKGADGLPYGHGKVTAPQYQRRAIGEFRGIVSALNQKQVAALMAKVRRAVVKM